VTGARCPVTGDGGLEGRAGVERGASPVPESLLFGEIPGGLTRFTGLTGSEGGAIGVGRERAVDGRWSMVGVSQRGNRAQQLRHSEWGLLLRLGRGGGASRCECCECSEGGVGVRVVRV
jgi:hypothetical protein